jgi:hypothetical protein
MCISLQYIILVLVFPLSYEIEWGFPTSLDNMTQLNLENVNISKDIWQNRMFEFMQMEQNKSKNININENEEQWFRVDTEMCDLVKYWDISINAIFTLGGHY